MATEKELKELNEVMRTSIIEKYKTMTVEQIADDVMILTDKAITQGFDAGVELTRKKVQENIQNWEREQIMKVLMS